MTHKSQQQRAGSQHTRAGAVCELCFPVTLCPRRKATTSNLVCVCAVYVAMRVLRAVHQKYTKDKSQISNLRPRNRQRGETCEIRRKRYRAGPSAQGEYFSSFCRDGAAHEFVYEPPQSLRLTPYPYIRTRPQGREGCPLATSAFRLPPPGRTPVAVPRRAQSARQDDDRGPTGGRSARRPIKRRAPSRA